MTDPIETTQHVAPPLEPAVREALIAVVGAEHALVTDAERDDYRDPYWLQSDRTYDSSLVLLPASTEEVQAIVRIANEHDVPLWTSSQGRNNGYGGPSPRVKGSVLVSLRRMDRVLEIDETLAYAVVEPGVRWLDLYDALQEAGSDLMLSIPDIGWGSVIGNSLDNGMTYLPLGSDYQAPCGMEVVTADGSLLRTNMGAIPGGKAWHLYKKSLGPSLDHLFTQSNYGIVTRMGVWLQRRPEAFAPLYLTVPRDGQLEQAVDIIRELRLDGVIRGVPNLQNIITMTHQFPEELGTFAGMEGPWPEEQLDELADRTGIGRWGVRTAVWGDRVVVEHHVQRIRDAWSAIEGSRVDLTRIYDRESWHEMSTFIEHVQAGIPSLDLMDVVPENLGHVGFSPVVPLVGSEVRHVADRIKRLVTEEAGSNFVCAIFPTNDRSCFIVSSVSFDRTDRAQWEASFRTVKRLVQELGEEGYGEYRAHIDFMDLATEQHSFGEHAYRRFTRAIKDAVDPNGILAPGRHGVWPARYLTDADAHGDAEGAIA